jgi:hypothetical protein
MTMATVETKVAASTVATFIVGALVAVLNAAHDNPDLLGGLPLAVQTLLLVLIPTLVTFVAGWSAPHTPRPPTNQ